MRSFGPLSLALLVSLATAVPVVAYHSPESTPVATLELSTDRAFWDETVTARMRGSGCSGETSVARHGQHELRTVYVDLLECGDAWGGHEFDVTVPIGPYEPGRFTIELQDEIRHIIDPPPPPLDTAELTVHRRGDVEAEIVGVPTSQAPFDLALSGLFGFANCVVIVMRDPDLERRVIELAVACHVLAIPVRRFETTLAVGPLRAGPWEIRFFELRDLPTGEGEPSPPAMSRTRFIVHDADRCVPSDTVLCLQGGRFRAEVEWTDFEGATGPGHAAPLAEGGETTGGFWFFREGNLELMVKVLRGCPSNGHWWVFTTAATNVGYVLTVTDSETGFQKTYRNEVGVVPSLRADTLFEACSPGA